MKVDVRQARLMLGITEQLVEVRRPHGDDRRLGFRAAIACDFAERPSGDVGAGPASQPAGCGCRRLCHNSGTASQSSETTQVAIRRKASVPSWGTVIES